MHRTDLHRALLDARRSIPTISLNTSCDVVDIMERGGDVHVAVCWDGRNLKPRRLSALME
jgi:2-polyprenyl-6-methoxyphenol hydroxylase-like FAD-dependent oxidoreductase